MSDEPSDDLMSTTGLGQTSLGQTSPGQTSPGKRSRKAGKPLGILPIGFVLNGIYEVKRFIARGGMGEVYEGVNVNADERVAIKVILPHLAADPKVQALFRKEAKTLISLAHPALVQYRVLAREPRKDLLYIVTDYIDGAPLTNLIGKGPPPATVELVRLTRRLAEGLEAAHSHGAIHRDISPENVLLPDGVLNRAKIIDFGIAKSMEIGAQTVVGDGFAGKLGYVAPEQFGDFGRRIGPWTDVYSLGLVALALAGGKAPDMGATLVDAIDRRRAGPDIDAVPMILKPLFARMLSPDPSNRPQTMAELITALDALDLSNEPAPSTAPTWVSARDALASDMVDDGERTVVHFGSEPPSWFGAEPGAETAPPITVPTDAPLEPVEPPQAEVPQGRTVFAPSPLPQPSNDLAGPPESAALSPPSVDAPTVDAAEVDAPELEPAIENAAEISAGDDALSPPATTFGDDDEEPISPAPPAMDYAYGSTAEAVEPPAQAQKEPSPPRAGSNGKLIAAGAVAAVVVAGIGVATLSSQSKGRLPVQPASTVQAPPASAGVVRAEQAIAAALPSIPCSWLSVGHGQASDGSTSILVSGAAGDPAAVNRAVASAVRKAGSAGLQIDSTGLLPAEQAACPLLDAARGARDPKAVAAPALVAVQTRFEIDRGIQGCPSGLWAQPVVNLALDPSKNYSLVAVQPSGRLEQFVAGREQLDRLSARNPNLYQDLGNGRHRVSMCLNQPGLAGLLLIEGTAPFDLGLRPGGAVKPSRDFAQRLGQLARSKGWTMQMAWFQLANDQPDKPETPAQDPAALRAQKLAEAAQKAAAAEAASNAAAPVVAAPPPEPAKLPADQVACRRFAGGAWEELGYANRATCVEHVFAGRCDVQVGRSGDIDLRRSGDKLQAKTGKGFRKWQNVGKSDCKG